MRGFTIGDAVEVGLVFIPPLVPLALAEHAPAPPSAAPRPKTKWIPATIVYVGEDGSLGVAFSDYERLMLRPGAMVRPAVGGRRRI